MRLLVAQPLRAVQGEKVMNKKKSPKSKCLRMQTRTLSGSLHEFLFAGYLRMALKKKQDQCARSHQSGPTPLVPALIGLKYDRWKCHPSLSYNSLTTTTIRSVRRWHTAQAVYAIAMDTFFGFTNLWWMEISSCTGESVNLAKTHSRQAGRNYRI